MFALAEYGIAMRYWITGAKECISQFDFNFDDHNDFNKNMEFRGIRSDKSNGFSLWMLWRTKRVCI